MTTIESTHVTIDRLGITIKEFKETLDKIRTMTVEEAAEIYVDFRDKFDYLDMVRDQWASVKDELSKRIIPEIFEGSRISNSITLKSGYRVGVSYKTLASMTDKIKGMEWLKENGLMDIIQPTVNAGTLASVAKTMAEENQSLPAEYFNVTTAPYTSVTKAKK